MPCENEVGIFHNIFALQPFHMFIPTFIVVSFLCCSVNAVNFCFLHIGSQSCLVAKDCLEKLVRFIVISNLSDDF